MIEELVGLLKGVAKGADRGVTSQVLDMGANEAASTAAEAMNRHTMGFFYPIRTQRAAFGDEFGTKVIDRLIRGEAQGHNYYNREMSDVAEALRPLRDDWGFLTRSKMRAFGPTTAERESLTEALRHVRKDGVYVGPVDAFEPRIIEAAKGMRRLYDRQYAANPTLAADPDKYLQGYVPMTRARRAGLFTDVEDTPEIVQWKSELRPQDVKFYNELERRGVVQDWEKDAIRAYSTYTRGFIRAHMTAPLLQSLEDEFVKPFFNHSRIKMADGSIKEVVNDKVGYTNWKQLSDYMLGGPQAADVMMTDQLNKVLAWAGKKTDIGSVHQVARGVQGLEYIGGMGSPLGGRPGSVMRRMGHLMPSFAALGTRNMLHGMAEAFEPAQVARLRTMGILSSPIDMMVDGVERSRLAGTSINIAMETGLKVFSAVDQWARTVTALAAEKQFDDAMVRGIETLKAPRELRDEVRRLVGKGAEDEAKQHYMFGQVATLQYIFGKANRPQIFRGALGSLLGVFTHFPLNMMEMVRLFGKQALPESMGGIGDPRPIAKLIAMTGALMWAGKEYLNADLGSLTMFNHFPPSMIPLNIALEAGKAGSSTVGWLSRDLIGVGESTYHRNERLKAYKDFAQEMKMFVPGGLFFWQDIPRYLDERNLARMFALNPLPADADAEAKLRMQQRVAEKRLEGLQIKVPGYMQ